MQLAHRRRPLAVGTLCYRQKCAKQHWLTEFEAGVMPLDRAAGGAIQQLADPAVDIEVVLATILQHLRVTGCHTGSGMPMSMMDCDGAAPLPGRLLGSCKSG